MSAATTQPAPAAPLRNVETEAALLGALMIDNRLVDRVADIVAAGDFYEPLHERLFAAIVGEVSAGRRADPILLRPMFAHDPAMEQLGGVAYLASLTGSGAALIGAVDFARQVADLGKRRRLYDGLGELMARAHDDLDAPVEALADKIDATLTAALQREHAARSMTMAQAFDATLTEIEAEARGEAPTGLEVAGLDDWNDLTGNMRRGEVVILAGRPSMGKTAVGLSAALAAARAGHGTLFVSLEMGVGELTKRAIADLIYDYGQSATYTQVQRGEFTSDDRARIAEAREQIATWPLILHEDAGLKVGRLAMMIRRYKRQMIAKGATLDVVFIDYLGLIQGDSRNPKRYEVVGEISRTIKTLARELNVAIVLLAQLNREVERREDKRPQLHDLRDSGEIEQDADTVLFVYREEYYLTRNEPEPGAKGRDEWELALQACRDRVELISAKVRKGKIGRRNCHFFAAHQAVRGSNFYHARQP